MSLFSFIIKVSPIIVPSAVSAFTVWNQYKINQDNNKRLLESDKLNNENQLKLKRLDYYYADRSSVVSKYLDDLYSYLDDPIPFNLLHLKKSTAKACMYVSGELYDEIYYINELLKDNKLELVKNDCLDELLNALCRDSQNYK